MNILEKLSKLEHSQWTGALKKIVTAPRSFYSQNQDRVILSTEDLNRWTGQSELEYEDLLPIDKEKDRVFARKAMKEVIDAASYVESNGLTFTMHFHGEDAKAWLEIEKEN